MMNEYIGYVLTGLVSFLVAIILKFFENKSNLCYWIPHQFTFELIDEKATLKTDSITVQNLGKKTTEQVEVIHKSKPDFFKISPSISYREDTNPNGEHVITIASLGPKEFFTIQLLSYKTLPFIMSVRSVDGPAKSVPITIQRVYPKTIQFIFGCFTILGMASFIGLFIFFVMRAI